MRIAVLLLALGTFACSLAPRRIPETRMLMDDEVRRPKEEERVALVEPAEPGRLAEALSDRDRAAEPPREPVPLTEPLPSEETAGARSDLDPRDARPEAAAGPIPLPQEPKPKPN